MLSLALHAIFVFRALDPDKAGLLFVVIQYNTIVNIRARASFEVLKAAAKKLVNVSVRLLTFSRAITRSLALSTELRSPLATNSTTAFYKEDGLLGRDSYRG
jgi:hypothetical protein